MDRVSAVLTCQYGGPGPSSSHFGKPTPYLTAEYPHLYAHLEGENVDSFKDVFKSQSEKGWGASLSQTEIKDWLV